MARRRSGKRAGEARGTPKGATVGHEAELWAMADAGGARWTPPSNRHPRKPGTVTVAGKPSDDLAPGTWGSIAKKASLDE